MTQIHAQRQPSKQEKEETPPVEPTPQPEARKLSAEADELLDEIDGLLEENAEEFVAAFIQEGGE